jgi:hypothetical protein
VLSVNEQLARIRIRYPDFACRVIGARLRVEGNYQPTHLGETYRVRIDYAVGKPIEVRVISPELRRRQADEKIPHMHRQELLCLHRPKRQHWTGDMVLADVVVPWVSLWLHYYELWHATGEWLGGGEEPEDETPFRRSR